MKEFKCSENEVDFLLNGEISEVRTYLKSYYLRDHIPSYRAVIGRGDEESINLLFKDRIMDMKFEIAFLFVEDKNEKLISKLLDRGKADPKIITAIIKCGIKSILERLLKWSLNNENYKLLRKAIVEQNDKDLFIQAVRSGHMFEGWFQLKLKELGYDDVLELYYEGDYPLITSEYFNALVKDQDYKKVLRILKEDKYLKVSEDCFSNLLDWADDALVLSVLEKKHSFDETIYQKLKKRSRKILCYAFDRLNLLKLEWNLIKRIIEDRDLYFIKLLAEAKFDCDVRKKIDQLLLKMNKPELISHYCKRHYDFFKFHQKIVGYGDEMQIASILNANELSFAGQDELLKLRNLPLLIVYTNKYRWSSVAKKKLSRLPQNIINAILNNGGAQPSEDFLSNTSELSYDKDVQEANLYLEGHDLVDICLERLQDKDFARIIKERKTKLIKLQLEHQREISSGLQVAIVKLKNANLIRLMWNHKHCLYFNRRFDEYAEEAMIGLKNYKLAYEYLRIYQLKDKGQRKLAQWGDESLILRLFDNHINSKSGFYDGLAQLELFKLGNKEVLKRLIAENDLEEDVFDELLKPENRDILSIAAKGKTDFPKKMLEKITALGITPKTWRRSDYF